MNSDSPNVFISLPDDATEQLADAELSLFWHNYQERTFWINSEINECTMNLIDYIMIINREDKGKPVEERKPIKILIISPGGSLDVADSLISMIKLSKTPIYGISVGITASAASLIYLACHKRYALPNTYLILHEGSCQGMGGNYAEIKAAMEDYDKQVEKMTQYYIDNTSFTEEEVRTNIKKDWYIYANEGVEKGIIHEIVEDIDDIL